MAKTDLTAQRLREVLHYDPETGIFTWRNASKGTKALAIAGMVRQDGYRIICIDQRRYRAHWLAWLYVTSSWPNTFIDHKDGLPDNNRIENLRQATPQLNAENQRRARRDSKSGLLGASPHQGKWTAHITVAKRHIYLGIFDTACEAHAAYIEAKRRLHLGCTI